MRTACFLVATVLLSGLPLRSLLADGLVRDGIGAISVGRGGANLGFADNGSIIHDNPAAMTNIAGTHLLDIGADGVITDLRYTDPDNDVEGEFSIFPSGMAGLVHRAPHSDIAYGLGMFAPAGFGARFRMDNPHTGPAQYKSIGAVAKILPAVAVQLTDRMSVGGTFGVAVGHAELEGPFYTQTGMMAGMPSLFDLQATGATTTWNVGLQYLLTPSTTLGVAYTEETRFDFEGSARTTMFTPLGTLSSAFDAETTLVWPRSLGIGLQQRLCECRRVGLDVYWYDWSDAFQSLDMRLTNPTDPTVAAMAPSIADSFPMHWRDTYSVRLGYEWQPNTARIWRTGYVYHRSPVPDGTLTPYLDGVLEHALSIGHSRLTKYGWLNLAYQYTWGPTRTVDTSIIVGDDFSNSSLDAGAHWLCISLRR